MWGWCRSKQAGDGGRPGALKREKGNSLGKGGRDSKWLWKEGLSMDKDKLDPRHPHECITGLM